MPGRDKTGPEGSGPFTGRGMGAKGGYGHGYGQGRRMRAGLGHGDNFNPDEGNSVILELEEEIKNLRKQVESLEKRISDSEINK